MQALLHCRSVPPLAEDWDGFYAGIHGGIAVGDFEATHDALFERTCSGLACFVLGNFTIPLTESDSYRDTAPTGGFLAGYNFAAGPFVVGVEGDVTFAGLSGISADPLASVGACNIICLAADGVQTDVNWYGTLRGRIGHEVGPMLLFVTAGVGAGEVTSTAGGSVRILNNVIDALSGAETVTETRYGLAGGAGAEFAVSDNLRLRGEWQFVNLGGGTAWSFDETFGLTGTNTYSAATSDSVFLNSVRASLILTY